MANPLGDSPAVSTNPLGDSPAGGGNPLGDSRAGNPLGDQPAAQANPLGDAQAPGPSSTLTPLGQMVEQAKANPDSGNWGSIAKFAILHPVDFAAGVSKVTGEVAKEYPAESVKAYAAAQQPNISLPRMDTSQSGVEGVVAGAVNTGEKVVEGLTAPANAPLMGAGLALAPLRAIPAASIAIRSLAAYYAASSLKTATEQAKTAGATLADPNATAGQKTEAVLDPLASAAMGGLAGKVALDAPAAAPANPLPTTQSTATALGYLDLTRTDALQQWAASHDPVKTLVSAKDAVSSATERAANTAANDVAHDLSNNFSKADLPAARDALVPAVESGLDPEKLAAMKQTLAQAQYKTPEAAAAGADLSKSIDFTLDHLEELQPAVDKYNAITSAVYQHAQDSGINFPYRENYVLHAQDFETPQGFEDALNGAGQGGSFRQMRVHDTYADSIAASVVPKTTDGVDLLRAAVRATQGMVNNNLWTDSLQAMKDPTNGAAIVVPRTAVTRPDGSTYFETPAGYSPTEVGGRPMAIQNGYAGLFDAMTDPSKIDPTLSKINATGKSITLAIDTYHLGRLAFYQAASQLSRGEAPVPTYGRGLLVGETPMSAIEDMAQKGEIDPKDLPQIREDKAIVDMGVNQGLNVGRIADSMHEEWVQAVPVLGDVNKFIFQQFQRGAIYDMFTKEFRFQQAENPQLSNEAIASKVARDVNTRLGNLGSQGLLKSKTAQDIARLVVLAPQWNEALIRSEVGGAKQLAGAIPQALQTGRFTPGLLGRTAATLAIGQFAANQVINLMTRGKPTWENPEEGLGPKLSAWIPDVIGKGPGFFLNPMTLPMEITHLLMKTFERTGDWRDAIDQYVRGRLSTIGRPVADIAMKHDALGRPLTTLGTIADSVPLPIAGSSAVNAAKQVATGVPSESFPGQFQKQALSTFGVRTDQAPAPEQRIQALASQFKRDRNLGSNAEYYSGDYQPLANALRVGNTKEAQSALDDLLEKKTPQAVAKHFQDAWAFPFTGSKREEMLFYHGLDPEQRDTYRQAIINRRNLSQAAMQALRTHLATQPVQASP